MYRSFGFVRRAFNLSGCEPILRHQLFKKTKTRAGSFRNSFYAPSYDGNKAGVFANRPHRVIKNRVLACEPCLPLGVLARRGKIARKHTDKLSCIAASPAAPTKINATNVKICAVVMSVLHVPCLFLYGSKQVCQEQKGNIRGVFVPYTTANRVFLLWFFT